MRRATCSSTCGTCRFATPTTFNSLRDLNSGLRTGETAAALEANGSGETTLRYQLVGLLDGKESVRVCS